MVSAFHKPWRMVFLQFPGRFAVKNAIFLKWDHDLQHETARISRAWDVVPGAAQSSKRSVCWKTNQSSQGEHDGTSFCSWRISVQFRRSLGYPIMPHDATIIVAFLFYTQQPAAMSGNIPPKYRRLYASSQKQLSKQFSFIGLVYRKIYWKTQAHI